MAASTLQRDERIDPRISADQKTLSLTPRDWSKFLAVLDKVERARPKLAAAARRYRRRRM